MTLTKFKKKKSVKEVIETLKGSGVDVTERLIENAHDIFTEYSSLQHGEELTWDDYELVSLWEEPTDSDDYALVNLCFERAL